MQIEFVIEKICTRSKSQSQNHEQHYISNNQLHIFCQSSAIFLSPYFHIREVSQDVIIQNHLTVCIFPFQPPLSYFIWHTSHHSYFNAISFSTAILIIILFKLEVHVKHKMRKEVRKWTNIIVVDCQLNKVLWSAHRIEYRRYILIAKFAARQTQGTISIL